MADRLLFISWGSVVAGREEIALEVFNESVGLYGRLQQDGRIEGFDTPHRAHCLSVMGWSERSVELSGGRDVITEELSCRADGGTICCFRFRWV